MGHNEHDTSAIVARIPAAVRREDMLYVSGHVGVDSGGASPDDVAHEMFRSLETTLHDKGFAPSDVTWTTVFIADLADFGVLNRAWDEFFTQDPPARTTVGSTFPDPRVRFEINAIAQRGSSQRDG